VQHFENYVNWMRRSD